MNYMYTAILMRGLEEEAFHEIQEKDQSPITIV